MKIIAIIQARTGSTRLPGKVLMDLAGEPMLVRVVNRTRRAKLLDDLIVATTELPQDDVLAQLCVSREWNYYRGSEQDVLDRYYQAAYTNHADVIVRITSDCPLIDPHLTDEVIQAYLSPPEADYVSNNLPTRTFPRGLDTEVFGFKLLEQLWKQDKNPQTREHVTLHILKNLNSFRTRGVNNNQDLSGWRWTVDTPEDLQFVRKIYEYFLNDKFSWRDVAQLVTDHPDWQRINSHIQQKTL